MTTTILWLMTMCLIVWSVRLLLAYHVRSSFSLLSSCFLFFFSLFSPTLLNSTLPRVKPGKFSLQECLRYGSFLSYIFGQLNCRLIIRLVIVLLACGQRGEIMTTEWLFILVDCFMVPFILLDIFSFVHVIYTFISISIFGINSIPVIKFIFLL